MNGIELVAIALAVAALAVALLLLRRVVALERQLAELDGSWRETLTQFRNLTVGSVGQGQHLARMEEDLARLRHQLEKVASQEGGDAAFGQAIRLARRGAEPDQIMETCGLSRMEADLVVLLHRESRQPSA